MSGPTEAAILIALEAGEDVVAIAIRLRLHLAQVQEVRRQLAEIRDAIVLTASQVQQIEKIAWRAGPEELRTAEELLVAILEAQAPERCSRCKRRGLPCLCADCMRRVAPSSPKAPPAPLPPPAPGRGRGRPPKSPPPGAPGEIPPALKASIHRALGIPPVSGS